MASVKITDRNQRAAAEKLAKQLETRLDQRALQLRNLAVKELSQPGKGRTYNWRIMTRGEGGKPDLFVHLPNGKVLPAKYRGTPHRASKPGDPPAVDRGILRSSIAWQAKGRDKRVVGTNVEYGPHLEFGTRFMQPRPFLRPAAEKLKQQVKGGK